MWYRECTPFIFIRSRYKERAAFPRQNGTQDWSRTRSRNGGGCVHSLTNCTIFSFIHTVRVAFPLSFLLFLFVFLFLVFRRSPHSKFSLNYLMRSCVRKATISKKASEKRLYDFTISFFDAKRNKKRSFDPFFPFLFFL